MTICGRPLTRARRTAKPTLSLSSIVWRSEAKVRVLPL